ncbi:hypothetical protein FBU30_007238 [Linnemannia zychae]|nr:hypothetical protein FBU30_007238 [Linnemannia zychae]
MEQNTLLDNQLEVLPPQELSKANHGFEEIPSVDDIVQATTDVLPLNVSTKSSSPLLQPSGSQYLNPPGHHSHPMNNSNYQSDSDSSNNISTDANKCPLPTSPSQRSIEKAAAQKFASLGMPPERSAWRTHLDQFLLNEGARVIFLFLWSLIQLLIFYLSFEIYNRSTHYSQARSNLGITLGISRGAAAVINFDCGLILFSVCRNLISILRSTFLNDIVPFDKNILFHKTVAWSIVFFSVIHSAGHYVNYYRLEQAQEKGEASQQGGGDLKKTAQYMALLTGPGFTGHMLVLILFLMVTSSVGKSFFILVNVGFIFVESLLQGHTYFRVCTD